MGYVYITDRHSIFIYCCSINVLRCQRYFYVIRPAQCFRYNSALLPMQSTPLPPNPCLIAILLVVQSRTGPRFVFHYPPRPSLYQDSAKRQSSSYTAHGTNNSPSDDSESSSSDETAWNSDTEGKGSRNSGGQRRNAGTGGGSTTGRRSKATRGSAIDEDEDIPSDSSDGDTMYGRIGKEGIEASRRGIADWERVLGYSTDGLQKLLCPPRTFHKKRFEICLDGLVFLGCPMFVREDGLWRKDKRQKDDPGQCREMDLKNIESGHNEESKSKPNANLILDESDTDTLRRLESSQELPGPTATVERSESATKLSAQVSQASDPKKSTDYKSRSRKESKLSMFNVVFVMSPPALEYHIRLHDMYRNVVREFAKILKGEQAQSLYVWTQSKEILRLKQKAKDESKRHSRH